MGKSLTTAPQMEKTSTIVFSFGLKQTNKPIKQTHGDSEIFGEKQCGSPELMLNCKSSATENFHRGALNLLLQKLV